MNFAEQHLSVDKELGQMCSGEAKIEKIEIP
jgi:hypothetical protein